MVSNGNEQQASVSADFDEQVTSEMKMNISEEDFVKAQKSFHQGKKNLMLNKYAESVNNIEEACRIYVAKFGEFNPQCADVYFYFGKALLELARVENDVLGNALTGAVEKEEISHEVMDAMVCETVATKSIEGTSEAKTVQTQPLMTHEEKNEAVAGPSNKVEIDEAEDDCDDDNNQDDDEDGDEVIGDVDESEDEEISNLQRAWEMFELAKLVYKKHVGDDSAVKKKRIAECLLKLGEIGIEQEEYQQACGDIQECIALQEEQCDGERDERMLAESYYQLGLAQQFSSRFDDAKESFQRALNILHLKTDKLKGRLHTVPLLDDDEKAKLNDEVAEIETLLPELNNKLEEVNEQDRQTIVAIQEVKDCFLNKMTDSGLNPSAVDADQVKDITCIMKSKRKISSGAADDDNMNGSKKIRLNADITNTSDTSISEKIAEASNQETSAQ